MSKLPQILGATCLAISTLAIIPAMAASHSSPPAVNHETMDHSKMDHSKMDKSEVAAVPKEPGQGAFATIAEIVAMLTDDPTTDWEKVDVNALREHLIDMDEVTLNANAVTAMDGEAVKFTITGTGRTLKSIQAMVPAHSGVLTKTTAWNVEAELTDNGAIMRVSAKNPAALKVVKALGFFGVMATGAHHQAHHFAMAKGDTGVHKH